MKENIRTELVCPGPVAVIGRLGLCTPESNICGELWKESNEHFSEVAELGLKRPDGSFLGFWGAMSDESMSFLPWTESFSRGYYLAGLEVSPNAEAPDGWVKWILPDREYLVVSVPDGMYGEIFHEVLDSTIPSMGLTLCGAVCDYTDPSTWENKLYFPVSRNCKG